MVGLIVIGYYLAIFFQYLHTLISVFFTSCTVNFKQKYGSWAIVTGATDGIGKAYATQLSKKHGLNIVLISRTQSKLDALASELPTECVTVAVDFSDSSTTGYDKIAKAIAGLDIGVLVNNVGMSYNHPECYHKLSEKDITDLIVINCFAQSRLIRQVLPGMEERKRGCIISLSSFSAISPLAYMGLYGATKEFNRFLSESIRMESKYVTMQTVMPYFVTTKLSKIRKSSMLIPTPENFVGQALKTVGKINVTFGCLAHEIYGNCASLLAGSPLGFVYDHITKGHMVAVMERAYKKKAQAKAE